MLQAMEKQWSSAADPVAPAEDLQALFADAVPPDKRDVLPIMYQILFRQGALASC